VNEASGSFLKKEPKNFRLSGRAYPERPKPKQAEVFCFFFSKKKALPELVSLHPIALFRPASK
jgi:hypothetical protein